MEWEALALTSVEYQRGDLFGKLMAVFSLSPLFISISFLTFIYCKRDMYSILFFIGLAINFLIVQVMKRIIQEPRPAEGPGTRSLFEYGMPSMHSQFLSFFTVFLSLSLALRWKLPNLWRCLYLSALYALSVATCVSRVYLLYHTPVQVLAGVAMGSVFGAIWYCITRWVSLPLNSLVLHSRLAKYFCVRSLSHLEDVVQFEYDITMRVLNKRE